MVCCNSIHNYVTIHIAMKHTSYLLCHAISYLSVGCETLCAQCIRRLLHYKYILQSLMSLDTRVFRMMASSVGTLLQRRIFMMRLLTVLVSLLVTFALFATPTDATALSTMSATPTDATALSTMSATPRYATTLSTLFATPEGKPSVPNQGEITAEYDSLAALNARISPQAAQLEALIRETKLIFFDEKDDAHAASDSIATLLRQFYVDQFRHARDPKSPYFLLMSKSANIAMGIGGVLSVEGWFDWNGTAPAFNFSPMAFPIPKDPSALKSLGASMHGTKLFYSIMGHSRVFGNYRAYIEGGFSGYKGVGFKLKKAYFTAGDFTIGRTTSTFCDPSAQAPTVDAAGTNSSISRSNILLRWVHDYSKHVTVGAGVEIPNSDIDADGKLTKASPDYIPDLAAFAQYSWQKGSHIRLSGLYRTMEYRNLLEARQHTVSGWGVQASSVWRVYRPMALYATASMGRGCAGYVNDLGGVGLDLIADPNHAGHLYAPAVSGYTLGMQYNFAEDVYGALSFAQLRLHERSPQPATDMRTALYGAASLFWDITSRLELGVEYLCGRKEIYSGASGICNRLDASLRFSF